MPELNYQDAAQARREIVTDWRRRLFGLNYNDVWAALAGEINARHSAGGWWKHGRVVADVGAWQLTLDKHVVSTGKSHITYTRLRAPFVSNGGLRFDIYRRSLFSDLGKLLGMQDIEVGDAAFDEAFIVKGNDEPTVRKLLADPALRALLEAQPKVRLRVKDDEGWFGAHFPEGVDELHFQVMGLIKDIDQLKRLFDLFAHTLRRLCEIGQAADRPAGVTL
jgi:hypothetical protein